MLKANPGAAKHTFCYPVILKGHKNTSHGQITKKNEQDRTGNKKENQRFVP
jgi:hypothetical protein